MDIRETERINCLYDLYGVLLTKHQQGIIEDYYQDNLSLAEIAENLKISRAAVFSLLKRVVNKLEFYESKLQLLEKKEKLNKLLDKADLSEKLKEEIINLLEEER
ncbi:MAG: YlxM family DNA-binding protein [Bacilli bacterium]|jgi:predicted DNA-binding protein YlxM (UPF0122 family)